MIAKWYICIPKKQTIGEYFGRLRNGKCWYVFRHLGILWQFGTCILWPLGIFYGNLVYFVTFWYVVCTTKKNLVTLTYIHTYIHM
jgi:hypothetical protein